MIKSLYIQDFVLIESMRIPFSDGLMVMTGETGAGKSIILGALALVLGQRADTKTIKNGANKCLIEAIFDISRYELDDFFKENDIEEFGDECILRRELYASGKSRAFVNDSPVSLTIMKRLGGRLIDIHSQHENLRLGEGGFQLKVLDIMAQDDALLKTYKQAFKHHRKLKKELEELRELTARMSREEDYARFQLNELQEANLAADEQEELEQEQETLSHAEEIKGALYKISDLFDGQDVSALPLLKEGISTLQRLEAYYPKVVEINERLRSAYIELDDIASEADSLKEDVEFNPERMDWINERLTQIYHLQQKHRVASVQELLDLQEAFAQQVDAIANSDEQIARLEKEQKQAYKELLSHADQLTSVRKAAAQTMAKNLVERVRLLGMPNTHFEIGFQRYEEPTENGLDEIYYLFSANKNAPLKPIGETASGGEISRLMLCLKSMIARFTALPTIIFDEVDTGVSGDIADKMGDIMQALAQKMQVLTISHLPQIASKGDKHYLVYKTDVEEHTVTCIKVLSEEDRILELARMLSGANLSDASIANAKDLLENRINKANKQHRT